MLACGPLASEAQDGFKITDANFQLVQHIRQNTDLVQAQPPAPGTDVLVERHPMPPGTTITPRLEALRRRHRLPLRRIQRRK